MEEVTQDKAWEEGREERLSQVGGVVGESQPRWRVTGSNPCAGGSCPAHPLCDGHLCPPHKALTGFAIPVSSNAGSPEPQGPDRA